MGELNAIVTDSCRYPLMQARAVVALRHRKRYRGSPHRPDGVRPAALIALPSLGHAELPTLARHFRFRASDFELKIFLAACRITVSVR